MHHVRVCFRAVQNIFAYTTRTTSTFVCARQNIVNLAGSFVPIVLQIISAEHMDDSYSTVRIASVPRTDRQVSTGNDPIGETAQTTRPPDRVTFR